MERMCSRPSRTLRAPRPHLRLQRLRARLAALQALAERVHGQAGRADALQLGLQVRDVCGAVRLQARGFRGRQADLCCVWELSRSLKMHGRLSQGIAKQ